LERVEVSSVPLDLGMIWMPSGFSTKTGLERVEVSYVPLHLGLIWMPSAQRRAWKRVEVCYVPLDLGMIWMPSAQRRAWKGLKSPMGRLIYRKYSITTPWASIFSTCL
jgi:hypothetical protein